jgi:hypothetical protein
MLASAYSRLTYAGELTQSLVNGSSNPEDRRWMQRSLRTGLRDLNETMYNLGEEQNISTLEGAYARLLELRQKLRQGLKKAA